MIQSRVDIVGKKYGKWEVLSEAPPRGKSTALRAVCRCECGKVRSVTKLALRKGRTTQCMSCASKHRYQKKAEAQRLSDPLYGYRTHISRYKLGATERNLEWGLTDDRAVDLFLQRCVFCNREGIKRRETMAPLNGIDRLDNTKGYVEGNVFPCCWDCNRAKADMHTADFVLWIKDVAKHIGFMVERP